MKIKTNVRAGKNGSINNAVFSSATLISRCSGV